MVDRYATGTIDIAWADADRHADAEIEAIVRASAEYLVSLYSPADNPWLALIEMPWRPFRTRLSRATWDFCRPQSIVIAAMTMRRHCCYRGHHYRSAARPASLGRGRSAKVRR